MPYTKMTLDGVVVESTPKWGSGLFWRGKDVLRKRTYITAYPGVRKKTNNYYKEVLDMNYIVSLKYDTSGKKLANGNNWYIDGNPKVIGDSTEHGVGNLANSCLPLNVVVKEKYANARLVEIHDAPPTEIVLQAITNIYPGDQILIDYHAMLTDTVPFYLCCCYFCSLCHPTSHNLKNSNCYV